MNIDWLKIYQALYIKFTQRLHDAQESELLAFASDREQKLFQNKEQYVLI